MALSAQRRPGFAKSHLSAPAGSGLGSLVRLSALARLAEVPRPRLRSLRFSALALAVSGVASVLLVTEIGAGDVADIFALRIVAYGCFLYGGVGLWTLLSPGALSEKSFALARLRGVDDQSSRLLFSTIARHLVLGMWIAGLPGIIASLLVSDSDLMRTGRLLLVAATAFYLFLFAAALCLLGALARSLAPTRTRAATFSLLLVPFLLSIAVPGFPNLISLFVWGFGKLIAFGGLFA